MGKNIDFTVNSGGIAELVFDNKDEKVNILTTSVMQELDEILAKAANDKTIKIMLVKSAKPGIFIAGADIHEIENIKTYDAAFEKSRQGQTILNKIEDLPFTTVSIVNGACLGGGLELALATDFRIVTDSKKVQLGAPEVNLGVIPGFGGTVRLPKLIGLPQALGMILTGKTLDGKKALKVKLADAYFPESFLEEKVNDFVKQVLNFKNKKKILKNRRKRKFQDMILQGNPIGRMIVFNSAKKDVFKKTRGFYPAPLEAVRVMKKNYGKSLAKALSIERVGFSKLAVTDISKKLISIFFLNENLKKAFQSADTEKIIESEKINFAGVLGAGKMGGGIAWLFSNANIPVRMKDISWKFIASGYRAISDVYNELKKIKKLDDREINLKMHKVSSAVDYSGFSNADVVIEAIIEDKDIKIKTLQELESVVAKDAIIATNTSSFSVDELSVKMQNPERFVGFHFFNPVNRMPLIEVVRGSRTSEIAVQKMISLARRLKKTPILVNDANGFLVNRILMAYLNEAILMLEQGVNFTKIDKAVFEFGMPMGPFTLLDEIGIKVGYKVAKNMASTKPDGAEMGKIFSEIGSSDSILGKASGSGFFIYKKGRKSPNQEIYQILIKNRIRKNGSISESEILDRCILRMINESALCLEEKIVEKPEYVDMALMLGIGFPPFRQGLLKYADDIGINNIFSGLEVYEAKYGKRFKPASLITEMAKKKERFHP
jgi:3-hydroxyacyl-CoA dehydrogenase / enoyl-CoA hydratase / 3-hydroxybutyryl-CoA epimerase